MKTLKYTFRILNANDTVVLTESKEQLRAALNSMYLYCQTWKLEVNHSKTKVVTFSKKKIKEKPVFTYNGKVIAIEEDLVYFSVTLTHNGSLKNCKT